MFRKCLFVIYLAVLPVLSFAADVISHTGKVTRVVAFPYSYGEYSESQRGLLAIYVEGLPKGCDSGQERIVIGVDHPIHDSVLSIALMAKVSGTEVNIAYFNTCTIRSESWDLAYLTINE